MSVRINSYREPTMRSHAAWACAGAALYWLIVVALYDLGRDFHIMAPALLWFFFGWVVAPLLAWRADLAVARLRRDTRPLAAPHRAAMGAQVGGVAVGMLIVGFHEALHARFPGVFHRFGNPCAHWILAASALGAWLMGRPPRARAAALGLDQLQYDGTRRSTVSWRDVSAVTREGNQLTLKRRGGEEFLIELRDEALSDELWLALRRRVADAQRPHSGGVLRREGRSLLVWRERMREALYNTCAFRTAPLSADDLRVVLTHPAATSEERVGAALLLCDLGEVPRSQVRSAADAMLDRETRLALHAVADGRLDAPMADHARGVTTRYGDGETVAARDDGGHDARGGGRPAWTWRSRLY